MPLSRKELQAYSRACEHLLSNHLEPRLTDEQKHFVVYYAKELLNKFDTARRATDIGLTKGGQRSLEQ